MKSAYFLLSVLLLLGCAVANEPAQTKETVNAPVEAAKTNQTAQAQAEVVVSKCEDSDGTDINVKGKTVLYYSNGQKESFNDYCLKEDLTFQVETTCDGIKVKEKINKCPSQCVKGVCV